MPVNIGKLETGPGWGCSCRGFRLGEPTPEQAFAALVRSVTKDSQGRTVTTERIDANQFIAWTDPESKYHVTFDPLKSGGWDKHILSCLVHWIPWFRQVAIGAQNAAAQIKELEKQNKKLEREVTKWQKKGQT